MAHISIVIPVYKVPGSYFHACMESVLNQTLSDIEVVLVDDGSPDACGAICDAYAKKDGRVRVLHQENQGVSAARNKGMDAATGKWLMFVDADDWIELNTCEKAVEAAERLDVQVLRFGMVSEWKDKREEIRASISNETVFSDDNKVGYIHAFMDYRKFSPLWGPVCTVFHLGAIKRRHIAFLKDFPLGEDQIFQMQTAFNMEKIAYLDQCLYHYRRRETSACGRYREDYDYHQMRFINRLKEIVCDNMKVSETVQQMFYIRYCSLMQDIILKQYFHPLSPLTIHERIKACNALIEKPENKEALRKIDIGQVGIKHMIYVFLLRTHLYSALVLLKRLWNLTMRRKAYE